METKNSNYNAIDNITYHLEEIMKELEIPITESNEDTPSRIARMWVNELFRNRNCANIEELDAKMKTFPNENFFEEEYTAEPITLTGIQFNSMCEHHWLPFSGVVHISYVPNEKIAGLSKLPRVVRYFSKMPQLQERLTKDIGEYLWNLLEPKWLAVKVIATHQCVKCRGAESDCATVTGFCKASPTVPSNFEANFHRKFNEAIKESQK